MRKNLNGARAQRVSQLAKGLAVVWLIFPLSGVASQVERLDILRTELAIARRRAQIIINSRRPIDASERAWLVAGELRRVANLQDEIQDVIAGCAAPFASYSAHSN